MIHRITDRPQRARTPSNVVGAAPSTRLLPDLELPATANTDAAPVNTLRATGTGTEEPRAPDRRIRRTAALIWPSWPLPRSPHADERTHAVSAHQSTSLPTDDRIGAVGCCRRRHRLPVAFRPRAFGARRRHRCGDRAAGPVARTAVTTILHRRLAILRPNQGTRRADDSVTDVRTTALLRVTPPLADADALPLSLIAGYAERYGLRADAIRVTSCDSTSEVGTRERETWIGVTLSAADNLAALQARSPQIPLHETAEVAARRLADHLRESGWTASLAVPDDVPTPYPRSARETWSGISLGSTDYIAAHGVKVDTALPNTLAAIWSYPVREVWTALEVAGAGSDRTLAVACAFRTDAAPGAGGPLPGLISQAGIQRAALSALDPLSSQRLDGHVVLPEALLLERLRWARSQPARPWRFLKPEAGVGAATRS